jgi:hypothetical protein
VIYGEVIHDVSKFDFHRYMFLFLAESSNDWQVDSLIATMSMYLNLWRFAMSRIHDHCQWIIHFITFYISAVFLDLSQHVAHSCRCVFTMGWWVICLRAHTLDRRFWRLDDDAGAWCRRRTAKETETWAVPNVLVHFMTMPRVAPNTRLWLWRRRKPHRV